MQPIFARTGMFLPRSWEAPFRIFALPRGWFGKVGVVPGIFAMCDASGSFFAAYGLKKPGNRSRFTVFFRRILAVVSLAYLPQGLADKVVHIALADPEVEKAIDAKTSGGKEVKVIGYLLFRFPSTSRKFQCIFQTAFERVTGGHQIMIRQKIQAGFTSAVLRGDAQPEGRDIVRRSINKHPLIEDMSIKFRSR